ncbi:hypothetical protein SNEBB_004307 [Seison nebaliae]|nr:hypothetical protein SNEBB_004307 [Seison nebaliae]
MLKMISSGTVFKLRCRVDMIGISITDDSVDNYGRIFKNYEVLTLGCRRSGPTPAHLLLFGKCVEITKKPIPYEPELLSYVRFFDPQTDNAIVYKLLCKAKAYGQIPQVFILEDRETAVLPPDDEKLNFDLMVQPHCKSDMRKKYLKLRQTNCDGTAETCLYGICASARIKKCWSAKFSGKCTKYLNKNDLDLILGRPYISQSVYDDYFIHSPSSINWAIDYTIMEISTEGMTKDNYPQYIACGDYSKTGSNYDEYTPRTISPILIEMNNHNTITSYHPMFDAQKLLNDHLENVRKNFNKHPYNNQDGVMFDQHIFDKQFSNDKDKIGTERIKKKIMKNQTKFSDVSEVERLPDDLPETEDTGFLAKLQEKKETEFLALWTDMKDNVGKFIEEMNSKIMDFSEVNFGEMEKNFAAIHEKLKENENTKNENVKRRDFTDLEETIRDNIEKNKELTNLLDNHISRIDKETVQNINDVVNRAAEILNRIFLYDTADLVRMIKDEAANLNGRIIENRLAMTELKKTLLVKMTEREHGYLTIVNDRCKNWKVERITFFTCDLLTLLNDKHAELVGKIKTYQKNKLFDRQHDVAIQLDVHFQSLQEFIPPKYGQGEVYNWYQKVTNIITTAEQMIDQSNKVTMGKISYFVEGFLMKVEIKKNDVIEGEICDVDHVTEYWQEHVLSKLSELEVELREEAQNETEMMENYFKAVKLKTYEILAFMEKITDIWDLQDRDLKRQEDNFGKLLTDFTNEFDVTHKKKEGTLMQQIDMLRQASSENQLNNEMEVICDKLQLVKRNFLERYEELEALIRFYHYMIASSVTKYENNIFLNFKVRSDKEKSSTSDIEIESVRTETVVTATGTAAVTPSHTSNIILDPTEVEEEVLTPEEKLLRKYRNKNLVRLAKVVKEMDKDDLLKEWTEKSQEYLKMLKKTEKGERIEISEDVSLYDLKEKSVQSGSTSRSTSNDVEPSILEKNDDQTANMEDDVETVPDEKSSLNEEVKKVVEYFTMSSDDLPEIIKNFDINLSDFDTYKNYVKLGTLRHLFDWKTNSKKRTDMAIDTKMNQVEEEMSMKLDVHRRRLKNIEMNVRNVRVAELVWHAERMQRHVLSVNDQLDKIFQLHEEEKVKLERSYEEFMKQFVDLYDEICSCKRSGKFEILMTKIQEKKTDIIERIRIATRDLRKTTDEMMFNLRTANANYLDSLKVFAEGGNYSLNEIKEFKKKLDELNEHIDEKETEVVSLIEKTELEMINNSENEVNKFLSQFNLSKSELEFNETLSRWFLLLQTEIKKEVKKSNNDKKEIEEKCKELTRLMDDWNFPLKRTRKLNFCKVVKQELEELHKLIMDRATYLEALAQRQKTSTHYLQGSIATALRSSTSVSKKDGLGKSIESVNVIRDILRIVPNVPTKKESKEKKGDSGQSGMVNTQNLPKIRTRNQLEQLYELFKEPEMEGKNSFIPKIVGYLRNAIEGVLTLGETFYKTYKGRNSKTARVAIQIKGSFEEFSNAVVEKFTSYFNQSIEYQKFAINDFRASLCYLDETLLADVSKMELFVLKTDYAEQIEKLINETMKDVEDILAKSFIDHKITKKDLRPTYGHPNYLGKLEEINLLEIQRMYDLLTNIISVNYNSQVKLQQLAIDFLTTLEFQLRANLDIFEHFAVPSDIIDTGVVTETTTGNAQKNLVNDQQVNHIENFYRRIRLTNDEIKLNEIDKLDDMLKEELKNFPQIDLTIKSTTDDLPTLNSELRKKLTMNVQVKKHTNSAHLLIEERNEMIKIFMKFYRQSWKDLRLKKQEQIQQIYEQKRKWENSIEAIKQLYVVPDETPIKPVSSLTDETQKEIISVAKTN